MSTTKCEGCGFEGGNLHRSIWNKLWFSLPFLDINWRYEVWLCSKCNESAWETKEGLFRCSPKSGVILTRLGAKPE